jgi:hypothetical protein
MSQSALPIPDPTVPDTVTLDDGRAVPMAFYDSVYEHVAARLQTLNKGVNYTAKFLCGEGFWAQLRPGEPSLAGRCLAHMVEEGMLPLTPVKSRHEYPMRYRLI